MEDQLNNGLVVVEDLEVFGYSEELDFELPGTEGMALTEAALLSGTMFLDVKHSLEGDVFLDYELPGVTFDVGALVLVDGSSLRRHRPRRVQGLPKSI